MLPCLASGMTNTKQTSTRCCCGQRACPVKLRSLMHSNSCIELLLHTVSAREQWTCIAAQSELYQAMNSQFQKSGTAAPATSGCSVSDCETQVPTACQPSTAVQVSCPLVSTKHKPALCCFAAAVWCLATSPRCFMLPWRCWSCSGMITQTPCMRAWRPWRGWTG